MTLSERIAIVSLVSSTITAVCALFLTSLALSESAKPKVRIALLSSPRVRCDRETTQILEIVNVGHWYGRPPAIDLTVYCNFPVTFEPRRLRYGSVQEHVSTEVKFGVGQVKYLKARGIKLAYGEEGEHLHVTVRTPLLPGTYRMRVTAFSANGANALCEFPIECEAN